jgi:hypothetical protein
MILKIKISDRLTDFSDHGNLDRRDLGRVFVCVGVYSYQLEDKLSIIFNFCGSRFWDRREEADMTFTDFATSEQCEIVDPAIPAHWHFKMFYHHNGARITALAAPTLCAPYTSEAMTNSEEWATAGLVEEIALLRIVNEPS